MIQPELERSIIIQALAWKTHEIICLRYNLFINLEPIKKQIPNSSTGDFGCELGRQGREILNQTALFLVLLLFYF